MQVTLVHNPKAGDESAPTRGQLKALVEEAGHEVRYQSVKDDRWWRVLKKSADLVAVAGGDGTVGKVARRMIGSETPIAVLPIGTANNVARTLGIADRTVTQLIPSWGSSKRRVLCAGKAVGPWGERHVIEAVGCGLFAAAIPRIDANETMAELPETEVRLTYTVQILRDELAECPAIHVAAKLDGRDISGKYLLFEAMLMKFVGPNLHLAPRVDHDDESFEIVMVEERDRARLIHHLKEWQEGSLWPAELHTLRGSRLELEWTGFPMHVDDAPWPPGEAVPTGPVHIELTVEPRALAFLIPDDLETK